VGADTGRADDLRLGSIHRLGAQADRLKQAMDFYGGSGALPEGAYDYVYLSRALHSGTYDTLLANMARAGWAENLCLPDACLWTRN
jgi:hypothetical protein